MKVAILGGGGCFALNFARLCESRGIEHFGIGRSGPKAAPFWLAPKEYRFWALHLVDQLPETLALLDAERPDVIVNFAAQGEGAASFGDNAPDFFRTNTWGLCSLAFELMHRDYISRFLQIGTSEAYGPVTKPAKEGEDGKGTSPYAISKQAFDDTLKTMFRLHKFPMNIVRPSNAYTPGQQLYRVIPKAIVSALSGKKLPLHGGGKAEKSYIHATDLSKALLDVVERGKVGKVYNCGPTGPVAIRTVVGQVAEACGVEWDDMVEEVPDRPWQDARYWLDSSELAKDTFWTPTVGLAKGISGMVEWVRQYPELLTLPTNYEHRA